MNRAGVVEVQFNWIFVLIAGGVILTFFVGIAMWWNEQQSTKIAGEALFSLSAVLTGAGSSSRTTTMVELPHSQLMFECDPDECTEQGCASSFRFEGTDVSQQTELDIIFSQKTIDSDTFYARTLDWNMPYKVSNFLYIAAPDVKHYLVYDSSSRTTAETIQSLMSKIKLANVELVEKDSVKSKEYNNEYLVKYVVFFDPGETISISDSIRASKRWDVMFVAGDPESGDVYFSKTVGRNKVPDDEKHYPYMGSSSLIGAIYAEDFDTYKCNMIKALYRLRAVNRLYLKRTQDLHSHYLGDKTCEFYYTEDRQGYFMDIADVLTDDGISRFDSSSVQVIMDAADEIETAGDAAQRVDCPRLY